MPAEAAGGRHLAGDDRGQHRLVDLHDPAVDAAEPSAQVGEVGADALCERLRELAAGAVVGEHLVAARLLDRGGQGPRAGDLGLERALVVLRQLLDGVEVLGEQRPCAPVVDPAGVGQPPAGGLEVRAEAGHDREPATRHRGRDASAGHLRHVREVGQLAQDQAGRLGVVGVGGAGHRAHAGGSRHAWTSTGRVDSMVAEPTTRVPS